jgi:sec-independent protein translocase protein TatB
MFDIGWSEFVVIGVVALIVIGPKELPGVLRAIGHWTTKIRRMAGEFQSQFQEAMREAEMADLKKQVDGLGDAAKGLTNLDALDLDVTKWEPKTDPKPDSKTELASPDSSPVTVPADAQGVVSPAEPATAEAPEPSPAQSPAAAPPAPDVDVGSTSEPHPAVPLTEGNGRA